MSVNKQYYYMKLKDNFFESENIVLLESMPDGLLYTNILLKMYLKSLKCNGHLIFNDLIPYNAQMIASVTRHQIGTVEKALSVFEKLGLIDVLDNGTIYMSDIELMIGKSSTEGERKKAARLENKKIQGGQMSDKCLPEIRDKSIDNNISKDILLDETNVSSRSPKHKYGEYKNVLLSDEEIRRLKRDIPRYEDYIDNLSDYIASKGDKYKSHYATIRNWYKRDQKKTENKQSNKFCPKEQRNYDFDDYEKSILSN